MYMISAYIKYRLEFQINALILANLIIHIKIFHINTYYIIPSMIN